MDEPIPDVGMQTLSISRTVTQTFLPCPDLIHYLKLIVVIQSREQELIDENSSSENEQMLELHRTLAAFTRTRTEAAQEERRKSQALHLSSTLPPCYANREGTIAQCSTQTYVLYPAL